MKIMLIHHVSDVYGASKSLLRLTSGLARDGHQVMVVLPELGPLNVLLEKNGVAVKVISSLPVMHRSRLVNPPGIFRLIRDASSFRNTIRELMFTFQPEVVHTNTGAILPVAGSVARSLGIRSIQHMRESFGDFGPLWIPYRAWLFRNADQVLCISSFIASMFTERQRAEKVIVVHNGIPRDEFTGIDPARVADFRQTHGRGGPLIGIVGRIKLVRKGQDIFVKAAGRIQQQFPAAQFVIVGSPFKGNETHLDALHELVDQLGLTERVHFAGHMDDPLVAIAALDISVMASTAPEPLGNVTIESMALGKPVIGTAVGGTTEIIEDGISGMLVPPGDPDSLASAMTLLLSDTSKAQQIGEQAKNRYLAHFEFAGFYEAMKKIYGIAPA
jgi:glycosyltransferase involved in cell wall biosynthesis